jgi:CRP/FNR family cyclic AMP-dependent transcriptional regulator
MNAVDIAALLELAQANAAIDEYRAGGSIFRQGDPAQDVRYLQSGGVKLTVASKNGQERVVGMLRPGDFFGEGCLAGQPVRTAAASALFPSTIVRVAKPTLIRLLHEQHRLSNRFIAHMLARNIRMQEDLLDQMMNTADRRLARTLVTLAEYGAGVPRSGPSQEDLAQMVGTTRSRVNAFLQRFKKLGYITSDDAGSITVQPSLHRMLAQDPSDET